MIDEPKLVIPPNIDPADHHLYEVFMTFDKDGDGKVSVEELYSALSRIENSPDEDMLQDILNQLPRNQNGEIDFEVFKDVIIKLSPAEKVEPKPLAHSISFSDNTIPVTQIQQEESKPKEKLKYQLRSANPPPPAPQP